MVYQADRPVTLLEVLAEAGGVANDAGDTVIVNRPAAGNAVPIHRILRRLARKILHLPLPPKDPSMRARRSRARPPRPRSLAPPRIPPRRLIRLT